MDMESVVAGPPLRINNQKSRYKAGFVISCMCDEFTRVPCRPACPYERDSCPILIGSIFTFRTHIFRTSCVDTLYIISSRLSAPFIASCHVRV